MTTGKANKENTLKSESGTSSRLYYLIENTWNIKVSQLMTTTTTMKNTTEQELKNREQQLNEKESTIAELR